MLRLLQGDVGSGKTVVALLAAATVIEAGRQAAMMAPTEILARQHLKTIAPLAEAAGLRVAMLTGRERGKERDDILARLEAGEIDLLVGTHALFQDEVAFRDLALAIVDEQHRFGVHQRLALARKGEAVDVLVMTATPIPRTLVLTYFGDMDVSQLREKPAGRQPIDTRAVPLARIDEVVDGGRPRARARRARLLGLPAGRRIRGARPRRRRGALRRAAAAFRRRVGLVHGKLKGAEKDAAMARFAAGETRLLVATTVIEVGVDVPEATVMVIEHAERFGLAQLHQLRGPRRARRRALDLPAALPGAARRDRQGAHRDPARDRGRLPHRRGGSAPARRRRSARHPPVRHARLPRGAHRDARTLLKPARKDAQLTLARDPTLTSPRGEALRHLLYLFERDEAIRLLRAGKAHQGAPQPMMFGCCRQAGPPCVHTRTSKTCCISSPFV